MSEDVADRDEGTRPDAGVDDESAGDPGRDPGRDPGGRRRLLGYVVAWLVAAVLAVVVGLVAVTAVGANLRGRGPLGDGRGAESVEGRAVPDPDAAVRRMVFRGDYGRFVVDCQGVVASGVRAQAAEGWRVISYEEGPDDDVDAVYSSGRSSVELEVYCNSGRPRLAEQETKTLPRPRPSTR